ncbi:MAG: hypothetical protein V7L21_35770 [Nostoc sp.]
MTPNPAIASPVPKSDRKLSDIYTYLFIALYFLKIKSIFTSY